MNTKKIIFAFLLTFIIFIPLQVKGQDVSFNLPEFLPDCDKTVYQVQQGGTVNCEYTKETTVDGKTVVERATGKVCVYPSSYSATTHGDILGTYINRSCGFNDFIQLIANAFNFGLAILAVVATFFFIWGGFGFIIAGGSQEKIQESKDILKGTFFGILIVLTAWMFVNTYIMFVTGNSDSTILGNFWWGGGDCHKTINQVCDKNNLHEGCGGERGSATDANVRKLQTALNNAACGCGDADGCFGPKTKKCVQNFQISNGILEWDTVIDPILGPIPTPREGSEIGDGIVGETTWSYINDGKKCQSEAFDPDRIGEGEYCCVPQSGCADCACYQTPDKTCGGLVSKGKYSTSEMKCSSQSECQTGCCVPDGADAWSLQNRECIQSIDGSCHFSGYSFVSRSCPDIHESCAWFNCSADTNDCVTQRVACPGGYDKVGWAGGHVTQVQALERLKMIDECNMGYCYTEYTNYGSDIEHYKCDYTSSSRCSAASGSFIWGGRCPMGVPCNIIDADNNDTGIECEDNWST